MKKAAILFLATLSVLFSSSANAKVVENEVYLGYYHLNLYFANENLSSESLTGPQVGYSMDILDHFGFRASVYQMNHDQNSGVSVFGGETAIVAGLLGKGFNVFGGVGYFSETWEDNQGFAEDFSGSYWMLGLGQNWEHVGFDLIYARRNPSTYVNYIEKNYRVTTDANATNIKVQLGFRF